MRKLRVFLVFILVIGASLFLFLLVPPRSVVVDQEDVEPVSPTPILSVPEPERPSSLPAVATPRGTTDISPPGTLGSRPSPIKAIYVTNWTAGSSQRLQSLLALTERADLNAMVIDVKDYSGYVAYAMDVPEVKRAKADAELRILRPNALLKELHDQGVYVIGRITIFQDPVLAEAHPEWALASNVDGGIWRDRKGLGWMDPAGTAVWDYNIAIAKDALARGFDEINFDYIRFPSDGDLSIARYPFWDEVRPQHAVIRDFFRSLRENLKGAVISADLFGLVTVALDDLGIGQVIEDAYDYFDVVSPMVYPSHYAAGFRGYQNPAQYPYEVVKYSMEGALEKLMNHESGIMNNGTTTAGESEVRGQGSRVKLRPWLQAFNLGATYDQEKVEEQIQAVEEVLKNASSSGFYDGWMLWDPSNTYTML